MALSFTVGEMRQVGTFQQNQPVDDDSGGQVDAWVDLVTTRGKFEKVAGVKNIEDGSKQFNKGYTWVCRYQSDLIIDQDTRLIIDGQPYQIMDWEKVDERNHLMLFNLNKANV